MLTTNQKGAVAETAVTLEAMKLGIGVYRALADGRYDLIFDLNPRLVRVQVKWAGRCDVVIVARLYSARRTAVGLRRRLYQFEELDAFALYCPDTDRCYFLDYAQVAGQTQVLLRLEGTKNNQREGVRWARDFEFGATLAAASGPIAQLGERRHGMPKAAGSSPAGSIE
jgi:PD-(D/E)XK endonuclease